MQAPTNEKLWAMVVAQAKARFRVYPCPAAAHWVHEHYLQHGGRFEERTNENRGEREAKGKNKHEKPDKDDK